MRSALPCRLARLGTALVAVLLATGLLVTAAPGAESEQPLVAAGSVTTTPGFAEDIASLPSAEPYGAFVHFREGTLAEQQALLESHGLTVVADYPSIDVAYAVGTVGEFRVLSHEPSIAYLEENKRLTYHGDTAPWATRARVAQEAVSGGPFRDAATRVLTGQDVGVAVVDSGIDGTHPDLRNRVGKNFKIICTTPGLISTATEQCFGPLVFADVGNSASTDNTSGHGTHVAGIVAGDGTASTGPYPASSAAPNVKGSFTGVAPGATLYGYGTGEVIAVLYATEAFQHILDNFDSFSPRVRVVNNSWGDPAGSQYDPNSVISKLVKQLVEEKGVTFMFSAGNSGSGTGAPGTADRTSSYCKDPTPGVVCVANYDDTFTSGSATGNGNRDGSLNASSSRGLSGSPTTFPDVSAPGTFYTSSCIREVQPICNIGLVDEIRWAPWYGSISGTSMASPHAAGVAALVLQARPDLTPAAVEDLLQDTAYKFTAGGSYVADPQNAGSTTSFDKGAGLLDVPASLVALGVPGDGGGGGSTTPDVRITDPTEGQTFDGTGTIAVEGTALDGTPPSSDPPVQSVVGGDGGDYAGPGAADIDSLTVEETAAGVSPAGLTFRMTVRNAADFPAGQSVTLRVTQNVNGRPFLTNVTTTPTSVSPGSATPASAAATSASRSDNTITFFIPLSGLGNPPAGSPAHNVFASSFVGVIQDMAPSPNPGAGADVLVRPMFGKPYTIARPQVVTPPAASVTLSVDGGPEMPAPLSGSSPAYTWGTSIDPSGLADGSHTLTARLYLNGIEAASHTVTFVIERAAEPRTYEVAITSPADGAVVPRASVEVAGTSFTDDPSTDRRVTLEVIGPEPSAEADATGTDAWSITVDCNRTAGGYTFVARLYVDGAERATDSIGVVVPPPSGNEVSCAPRGLGFWRGELDGQPSRFSADEVGTLADEAVRLSTGYFSSRSELSSALFAGGSGGAEARAARQFAALLLNLAGGNLSASMSYQAGLSGSELLDPAVYDTAVLGPSVETATAWIRSQLPSGNLGGANEVANAINNGQGLLCG